MNSSRPTPSPTPANIHKEALGTLDAAGLTLDINYQGISASAWKLLFSRAKKAGLSEFITDMFTGKVVNASERRPALHSALRNLLKKPILVGGEDVMPAVSDVWRRIERLCNKWVGITDVIHIGIGGSDFGPRLIVEALAHVPDINSRGMRMHFLANIDTSELARILNRAQPNSTRIIIVSKTFTTLETMMNARAVVDWMKANNCTKSQIAHSLIAVTTNISAAKEFGVKMENIYPFWNWVGGRFSVWSAVGLPIALQYGFETFKRFLEGAQAMDIHFQTTPFEENLPVIMALALVYQQEKRKIKSYAVIPYADALNLFPTWLQQLDMESHGKSVGRDGNRVQLSSPVVFGSAGCNAQHSFFQLLHQGGDIIPIDFIVVREPMSNLPEASAHHRALLANCLAQAQALSHGKEADNPNEVYPGKRPSSLLVLPKLNAYFLGALLALYENRAATLGVLWNINTFDQPGVELGKVLAKPIEAALNSKSPSIKATEGIDSITAERINYLIS